ncbi:MAG: hypothetical protein EA392_06520 [Cryomorphaceae bacterium]|nr:MAG: hypothetical protein EA392_06520 [Cryomorphaceae bacterium]
MKTAFAIILALILTGSAFGQCKSFTRNSCRPVLEDFIPNENYNSTLLVPGDEAELNLTFFSGQEYRLLVCSHPLLGEVNFTILDDRKNEIYARKSDDQSNYFDFRPESTQKLKLRINVPMKDNPNELIHEGCVTVMIGFKEL